MLWESNSDNKDDSEKGGWGGNNNPLHPPVTPVLIPTQSGSKNISRTVPVIVPDVEELKEQFQQQQNMLLQLKETIKENESQLSSKGKKVEAYANRLSQIQARTKNSDIRSGSQSSISSKPLTRKTSKENITQDNDLSSEKTPPNKVKLSPKGKIGELKKRLQESKIKFEERAGKEESDTKKIETIVENLRMQLEERDVTIQELQKIVEQPNTPKSETTSRRSKSKSDGRSITTKSTQTMKNYKNDESIEIISLQNRIHELEANILDLEESLKEKESVIDARTQAVTLLSQDLSIKGKNTLECLEETRQEMRSMQNNFIIIENQLKKELVEKDKELASADRKLKDLESFNSELESKNAELLKKLSDPERNRPDRLEPVGQLCNDDKITELSQKINVLHKEIDDSNKSMIKMKLEHKNKVKSLNKIIEKLSESSDDKAEILRLQSKVDEFEVVKESFQNKIAELEEEKATEKKLRDHIQQLEEEIVQRNADIERHLQTISNLERETHNLHQSTQDQNILIENLYAKIQTLEAEVHAAGEKDATIAELQSKLSNVEDEHKAKLETIKLEHAKKLETCQNIRITVGDRKEFEEYRISNELNNVQVEEQIEMLIREKQQLLEKLKSLTGVSPTESFTFETVEHSDLQGQNETKSSESLNARSNEIEEFKARELRLQGIADEQQTLINNLQEAVVAEKKKAAEYQRTIGNLEESIKKLEQSSAALKPTPVGSGDGADVAKTQKSNANVKNKIKKMQTELAESKVTIKDQKEKLEELNMKLEEKEKLIKNYIEKIESFEKDDWGRESDWKSGQDDFEHMQELQKKCLSLENSLIELTEDCERLRKENIEVVHLLSEEKVKRKKLLERLQANGKTEKLEEMDVISDARFFDEAENAVLIESPQIQTVDFAWPIADIEERVFRLAESAEALEARFRVMEVPSSDTSKTISNQEVVVQELQQKLEWSNIVLTSMETEIFKLQNLLEDSSKTIEDLERNLKETKEKLASKDGKLNEMIDELHSKEKQVEELSLNFDKLQESVNIENERTSSNETQLKQLMATVKEMEGDAVKKENELKEIQGILAEKNLDIHNLKLWLEQANSDLTYSYKEHLENMDKCLRDKEQEFDVLLNERNALEEERRNLISINEDVINQRRELLTKTEALEKSISDKDVIIQELNNKLLAVTDKAPSNEKLDELKLKVKRLAGNLKKKVQNENDLLQQIKDHEGFLAEKESAIQQLQKDLADVNEKWMTEKTEKEQFKGELAKVLALKSALDTENVNLIEKLKAIEADYNGKQQKADYKFQQMEIQLQKMYENSEKMKSKQEQDKIAISNLEVELSRQSKLQEDVSNTVKKENEELKMREEELLVLQKNLELKLNELNLERTKLLTELEESRARSDNSCFQAKIQEQMAVIESLETDLTETRDHLKRSEDKLCFLEERRSSLEMKNEEMLKKFEEQQQSAVLIDEMSNEIQSLIDSEKNLKLTLKALGDRNKELEEELKESKAKTSKDIGEAKERANNLNAELSKMRDLDTEKSETIEFLTSELEKLKSVKMDNKHKSAEIEKLYRDIQLLEADLKENIENSKLVEKTLNHKIDELMKENAALEEKNLFEANNKQETSDKTQSLAKEEEKQTNTSKPPKRKKSVTFKTDESDYIRELKAKLQEYSKALKKAEKEIEDLKMDLVREKLRNAVAEVVIEAKEKVESLKSTPEKTLEPQKTVKPQTEEERFNASTFFGGEKPPQQEEFFDQQVDGLGAGTDQVNIDFDSLMWDDGWGTDGHLEEHYLSMKVKTEPESEKFQERYDALAADLKSAEEEKRKLEEEMQVVQGKYAKAMKKLKDQKATSDKLQAEVNRLKSDAGFGGLDGAILDELKSQIRTFEQREKEMAKTLEASKTEKEGLLKRIEVLNAGNEKFIEMKERQDNQMDLWEMKNRELQQEIAELRNQAKETVPVDDTQLATENRELKNRVEGLEWEICELKELLEEKQEILETQRPAEEKSQLTKEIAELNDARRILEKKLAEEEKNVSIIEELQERVTALAAENQTLQEILEGMKMAGGKPKAIEPVPSETKIFDYFKSAPVSDPFAMFTQPVVEEVVQKKTVAQVYADNSQYELERLMQENKLLKQETAKVNPDIESLQRELDLLKQENELIKQRYAASVEAAGDKLQHELNQLRQENELLKQRAAAADPDIERLQNELDQLKRENEILKQRVAPAVEAVSENQQQEMDKLRHENELLKQMTAPFQSERGKLQQELEQLKQENKILKERAVAPVEAVHEKLQQELNQLRQENEYLGSFPCGQSDKEQELDELRMENNFLKQQMAPVQVVSDQLKHELDQLRQENELSKQQITDASLQAGKLQQELDQNRMENELLKQQLGEAHSMIATATNEKHEMAEKYRLEYENALSFSLEEKNHALQKVYELEQALAVKIEELGCLSTKIKELDGAVAAKVEEMSGEAAIREKLQKELSANTDEANNLRATIHQMEMLLEATTERLNAADAQLKAIGTSKDDQQSQLQLLLFAKEEEINRNVNALREAEKALAEKSEETNNLAVRIHGLEEEYNSKVLSLENLQRAYDEVLTAAERSAHSEIEELNARLNAERLTTDDLRRRIEEYERESNGKLQESDRLRKIAEEHSETLGDRLSTVQTELETANIEIGLSRKEVEDLRREREFDLQKLEHQSEVLTKLETAALTTESLIETLKSELKEKDNDIFELGQTLEEERKLTAEMRGLLQERESEITELKQTLSAVQEEISSFRNFEKQVKELRLAQMGSKAQVTAEGDLDFTNWTEHELAELNTRLQSDLDTALYILHQRDIRCDELTFELMQLLEERDTLQLRLSTAIRLNEELRSLSTGEKVAYMADTRQENKDLIDQSNDRRIPGEDLNQLAQKISELHSVGYMKDKTIQDDTVQRHRDQMTLLGRVSDSDLSRQGQASPAVLMNWMRGKTTPKVMHI